MDKNKPYDFPELFRDFAFMPKFTDDIDALAKLAEPEKWDYKNSPSTYPHPILLHAVLRFVRWPRCGHAEFGWLYIT